MKTFAKNITVSTRERHQLVDVTESVEEIVSDSAIKEGLCLVHASHATAAIICNENERGLVHDVLQKAKELFPL